MTTLIYVALLLPVWATQGQAALLPYHEQDFGIGFDLTPSYATAAVSFANGSKFALARVDGNVDWYNMMADVSFNEGGNLWETRTDSHIRTLANMLLELTHASEERL